MTESDSNPYEAYSMSIVRDFKPTDLPPDSTGRYGVIWVYYGVLDSEGMLDKKAGTKGYLSQRYYLPKSDLSAHIKGRAVTGDLRLNDNPLVTELDPDDDVYKLETAGGVVTLRTVGKVRRRQIAEHAVLEPGTLFSVKPLLGRTEDPQQTLIQEQDTQPQEGEGSLDEAQ